jgi:hypothetical protein
MTLPSDVVILLTTSRRLRKNPLVVRSYRARRGKGQLERPARGIRIALKHQIEFPLIQRIPTEKVWVNSAVDRALMDCEWFLEYEETAFNDRGELAIYHVGRVQLRATRQFGLAGAAASPLRMNRTGLEWLRGFRRWMSEETDCGMLIRARLDRTNK